MFSSLRIGTPIYVLHKNDPHIDEGEVQSVGLPTPQYGTAYIGGTLQPQKMVVDIKIKVGEHVIDLQKLPADQTIADFGTNGMVVSESRESILNEIDILQKSFQSGVDNYDRCVQGVERCKQMRVQLDPSAKQDAQQREEIESLKQNMEDIKGMLSKLLNTKSKKED